jgi:hypothetical protein
LCIVSGASEETVIASLGKFNSEIYENFLVFGKKYPQSCKKWGKVGESGGKWEIHKARFRIATKA